MASTNRRLVASEPDFLRWAVTGVLAPFLAILILRFVVAPPLWGEWVSAKLGSLLGEIFLVYLFFLVAFAAIRKVLFDRKQGSRRGGTRAGVSHEG